MFFVSETCVGYNEYPSLENYVVISDPESSVCLHGGMAWYIKESLFEYVFAVTYVSSSFGFSLEMFPNIVFIGVYVKPEGSKYFDPCMFAELCAYVLDCHERSKIVYLGGDFNSRPGDFNCIIHENSVNIPIMLINIVILVIRHSLRIYVAQLMFYAFEPYEK